MYVYQNIYQDDVLYLNIDLIFKTVIKGYIIFNWHIIYNTYQVDKKLVGCDKISPLDSKAQYQVVTENNEELFACVYRSESKSSYN